MNGSAIDCQFIIFWSAVKMIVQIQNSKIHCKRDPKCLTIVLKCESESKQIVSKANIWWHKRRELKHRSITRSDDLESFPIKLLNHFSVCLIFSNIFQPKNYRPIDRSMPMIANTGTEKFLNSSMTCELKTHLKRILIWKQFTSWLTPSRLWLQYWLTSIMAIDWRWPPWRWSPQIRCTLINNTKSESLFSFSFFSEI